MKNTDAIVNTLMNVILASSPESRRVAMAELERLRSGRMTEEKDPEMIIRDILLEISAPDHLVGHPYVVQGILLMMKDREYINNITLRLYPHLAAMFDTTASRVERAIRHAIEVIWTRADYEILDKYFGNIVSAEKGKPTNSEFLARMANIVNMEMRK